eukprot:3269398-Amphidinium_carterae.1
MKRVAEETLRVSTRRRIEERPDPPTSQADWYTRDYYSWQSDHSQWTTQPTQAWGESTSPPPNGEEGPTEPEEGMDPY